MKTISKDEYEVETSLNNDKHVLFKTKNYTYHNGQRTTGFPDENETFEIDDNVFYGQIDTKGLTPEEINLLLKIDQTQNIRSIKNMATFFVVLTVISLVISIISAVSVASMF